MKRTLSIILVLSMIAGSMLILSGCGDEHARAMKKMTDREKAKYLTDMSEAYYANGLVINDEVKLEAEGTLMGERMTYTVNQAITDTRVDNGDDELSHLNVEKGNYVMVYNDESINGYAYNMSSGYTNGQMFYTYTPDVVKEETLKRKSECDAASYREYLNGIELPMNDVMSTFQETHAVIVNRNEDDNSWNIMCQDLIWSGFDRITENVISDLPEGNYTQYTLDTYRVNIKVNGDTLAVEEINIDIDMTFEGENTEFTVSLDHSCRLSLPQNDVDLTPDGLESYDNIGDLMMLYDVGGEISGIAFSNVYYRSSVHYDLADSLTVKKNSSKPELITKHSYVMNYGIKKGTFLYDVECHSVSEDAISEYRVTYDGRTKRTNIGDGASIETEEQSFRDACGFVNNIVYDYLFNLYDVYEIVTSESGGRLTVTLKSKPGIKEELVFSDMEVSPDDVTYDVSYIMTFDAGGYVEKYEYVMVGTYTNGEDEYSVSRIIRINNVRDADFSGIPAK